MCIYIVFRVYLPKKYVPYVNHVIDWNVIEVEPEGEFQVKLVCILDWKIKQLWNRAIRIVKVQWTSYVPEDETWEHEGSMWEEYFHLFEEF
jgi:hypothetical protein